MKAVSYLRYPVNILTDVCTSVTQLTYSILHLKENKNTLYEYLRVLANHKLNPLIVLPDDLCDILVKVKHDMQTNTHMELPDDADRNILANFSVLMVTT